MSTTCVQYHYGKTGFDVDPSYDFPQDMLAVDGECFCSI